MNRFKDAENEIYNDMLKASNKNDDDSKVCNVLFYRPPNDNSSFAAFVVINKNLQDAAGLFVRCEPDNVLTAKLLLWVFVRKMVGQKFGTTDEEDANTIKLSDVNFQSDYLYNAVQVLCVDAITHSLHECLNHVNLFAAILLKEKDDE